MKNIASIIFTITTVLLVTACQMSNTDTELPLYTLATLAWIDREGHIEPINIPAKNYIYAQVSPDGSRLAINARDETSDIWIYDLEAENLRRLTQDAESNIGPLWAPDGRIAYTRIIDGKQEIVIQAADLFSPAEPLTLFFTHDINKYPTSFSEDEETLIFHSSPNGYDMWSLALNGGNENFQALFISEFRETNGVLSPDGHWLAYELDETGGLEIYVSPFPNVDSGRIQISVDGGSRPHWHSDGNELFYIDQFENELSGAMMVVDFDTNSGTIVGRPELLFEGIFHSPLQGQGRQLYDVSADGQRFLMIQKAQ